jgi:hypothetical protein
MPCQACTRMCTIPDQVAHDELVELHKPKKLRPLGRPAIVVRQYRCRLCGTNWLSECDPLRPGATDWLCLNKASNILAPASTSQPGIGAVASGSSGEAAAGNTVLPLTPTHGDGSDAIFFRATASKA